VSIDGLNVTSLGGVAARDLNVPEAATKYPDPDLFGELPALGLYGRHVDGLTIRNLKLQASEPDGRPAIVLDDVANLELSAFDSRNVAPHQPMLLFRSVAGAFLYGNRLASAADVFLSVLGGKSGGIALRTNDLRLARQAIQQSTEVPHGAVSIEAGASH
jgi:hypothetical protein